MTTEPKTVQCGCGDYHKSAPCSWRGPITQTVVIEYMPPHLRTMHTDARNRGRYPANGAKRIRVQVNCGREILQDAGDWADVCAEGSE